MWMDNFQKPLAYPHQNKLLKVEVPIPKAVEDLDSFFQTMKDNLNIQAHTVGNRSI